MNKNIGKQTFFVLVFRYVGSVLLSNNTEKFLPFDKCQQGYITQTHS